MTFVETCRQQSFFYLMGFKTPLASAAAYVHDLFSSFFSRVRHKCCIVRGKEGNNTHCFFFLGGRVGLHQPNDTLKTLPFGLTLKVNIFSAFVKSLSFTGISWENVSTFYAGILGHDRVLVSSSSSSTFLGKALRQHMWQITCVVFFHLFLFLLLNFAEKISGINNVRI